MKTKSLLGLFCALVMIGAAACTDTGSSAPAPGSATNASAAHAGGAGGSGVGPMAGPAGGH